MNWRHRHTLLVVAFLAFYTTMVARLAISPLIPSVIEAFSVSKSAVGAALTGMWAAYALMQFPSGVLGERYGERRVILVALGVTATGSALLAAAPSFVAFGAVAVLVGVGTGLYFSVAASLLTRSFENTGGALGLHTAGGPVAGLTAPVAAAYVGSRYGWRAGVALGAAVAVPVWLVFAWRVRPTPPTDPGGRLRDRFDLSSVAGVLARPAVAFTTAISAVSAFAWQAFATFFPTFLIEAHGLSAEAASVVFGSVFVISAAGLPVFGRLSDAVGRDAVVAFAFLCAAAGIGVFLSGTGLPRLVVGTAALGVGTSWGGALQSRVMDHLAEGEQGTGFGLVRTVYVLLGSTGSVVTGTLADSFGWSAAYGVAAVGLVLAAAAVGGNRALRLGL